MLTLSGETHELCKIRGGSMQGHCIDMFIRDVSVDMPLAAFVIDVNAITIGFINGWYGFALSAKHKGHPYHRDIQLFLFDKSLWLRQCTLLNEHIPKDEPMPQDLALHVRIGYIELVPAI